VSFRLNNIQKEEGRRDVGVFSSGGLRIKLILDTFPTREAFDLGVQRTTISKSIAAKGGDQMLAFI
jgi:hypothetical protein